MFISKFRSHGHTKLKRQWSKAKIALSNTLARFEELLAEKQLSAEDLGEVELALRLWEDRSISLTRVPGMRYARGAEEQEPTEEDHEFARLMMQYLKVVLENELTADDKAAVAEAKFMESAQHDNLTGKDQAAAHELPVMLLPPKPPARSPASTLLTPRIAQTPKSILKRSASLTPSLTPSPSRKRIRLADIVTVSPASLNISNPSPFIKLTNEPTLREHRHTATAENRRRRTIFWRPSPLYEPGAWASGGFESKANTSYYKAEWESMEQEKQQEEQEAEEEQRVAEGLKLVAGVWMGVWWVKKVLGSIDLKKAMEEAKKT